MYLDTAQERKKKEKQKQESTSENRETGSNRRIMSIKSGEESGCKRLPEAQARDRAWALDSGIHSLVEVIS